jgi:hypothetical protein
VCCSGSPRFRLIVLNRLSITNLVVDITHKVDLEDIDPYLIVRLDDYFAESCV